MSMRITVGFGFLLALAACGGSGPDAGAASGAAAPAAAEAAQQPAATPSGPPDACTVVSPEELGEVFAGRSFVEDNAGPVPRNRPGKAGQNSVTSCTWTSAGASIQEMMSVTVVITTAPSDAAMRTVEQMKDGVRQLGLGAAPADIPGVGDGAYWTNLGTTRRSAVAVNVSHKPRTWLTVSESSAGQDVEVTVQRLTSIAQRVLPRL